MDFVFSFLKVKGTSSVLVVVDQFLKYVIFSIATHTCSAEIATNLFFKNVVKHFGVPLDIVNDRDTRFTSRF